MAAVNRESNKRRATAVAATAKVREATLALLMSDPSTASLKKRPFACTLCEKRFQSKSHLNEHQRVHTGERPFPCVQCGLSFTTQHNLKRHQTIHAKEDSYRCHKCSMLFCTVHQQRKTPKSPTAPLGAPKPDYAMPPPDPKKEKTSQGPSPPKRAKRVRRKGAEPGVVAFRSGIKREPMAAVNRKLHVKGATAAATAVAATVEVREASSAPAAGNPTKASQKKRPFACTLCEKRFQSKSHFNEHQRVHTGERPFPCQQCELSFTTNHNLKRHRTIHAKEASYRCHKCGMLFCTVHENGETAKTAPAPLTTSTPDYMTPPPDPKKEKTSQAPSPPKRAKRVRRKGAEPGVVALRKHTRGLQNKIAYDIEVVL